MAHPEAVIHLRPEPRGNIRKLIEENAKRFHPVKSHPARILREAGPVYSVLYKGLINIIKGILSGNFGPANPILHRSEPLIESSCVLDGLASQDDRRYA
jgi:hypothetical protein